MKTRLEGLVYHTFYAEFRGVSVADLIEQLYVDSRNGTGWDFTQWWTYQRHIWCQIADESIPADPSVPGAKERLLEVLVQVQALWPGPMHPGRLN